MGLKERRERERSELRTRIMDAARQLFLREGYDAVSMRRIADAIEYSPTAIYVYFKDKESLIREMCRVDFGNLAGAVGNLAKIADPIERIRQLGVAYIRFAVQKPNHYRLMFMTTFSGIGPTAADIERKNNPDQDAYAFLIQAVREGLAAGRFRPELTSAELIAQVLWSAVHGVASLHIVKANDPWLEWAPLEQRTNLAVDAILRGLVREDSGKKTAPAKGKKR
ncbi:MAG TPA: TetR/AcrR family transcriptional regulator [Tepidisphaeraceae bacterium]|nr:TetR/AcrR family transcriptional regulator [Tepidisphaeraceae bacterium]